MKCVYINLDSRPERRKHMESLLKRVGLTAERYPAVVFEDKRLFCSAGMRGCGQSHLNVLKSHTWNANLLVFEDDVELVFLGKRNLQKVLKKLETVEWAVCYLDANSIKYIKKSNCVSIIEKAYTTSAIIYNYKYIPKILELVEEKMNTGLAADGIYFNHLNEIVSNLIYCATPTIFFQKQTFGSDTSGNGKTWGLTKTRKKLSSVLNKLDPYKRYFQTI